MPMPFNLMSLFGMRGAGAAAPAAAPAVPMTLPGMPGAPQMGAAPAVNLPAMTHQPNALGITGATVGANGMPVAGTGGIAPPPSAWERFGNITKDPRFAYTMGMLGASISPAGSVGQTMGQGAATMAAGPLFQQAYPDGGGGGFWNDPRNRTSATLATMNGGPVAQAYGQQPPAMGGGGYGNQNFR